MSLLAFMQLLLMWEDSCVRGEGDPEISELFNHVQDGVIDKQG